MYRPKNWNGQWAKLSSTYPPNEGWMRLMREDEREIFEAGADAHGEWLTSQEHQDWLATPEGEACKGRWVFIPEEKEDGR